ncbi:MAG: hypothetical protein WCS27_11165 [Victivallaceae bacterium]
MKNLFTLISAVLISVIILSGDVFAAGYSAKINVFSNYKPLGQQPFAFFIDFKKEINPESLKMTPVDPKEKDIKIPVYAVPLSKYKAIIYFIPHQKMDEDSELNYVLTFADGKWDGKAAGDEALKKDIESRPNLIPNYSFEKVYKAQERFLTWNGETEVADWRLLDYSYQFASLENPDSTCRVCTQEAVHGLRSLCFKSGKPCKIKSRNELVSGSAYSLKDIVLKPNTVYKLSFFLKIAKRFDNGMNFQGVGVSMTLLNNENKALPGGIISALYSINTKDQDEYLNKWVYVQMSDITPQGTSFGRINIAEKISGTTYVDMIELREIKENALPEIIVEEIKTEK